MPLLRQILKNFRVVDYIIWCYCVFAVLYAGVYYSSFEDGQVLQPSRFVVTNYHKSQGAATYSEMVTLGVEQGYYSTQADAPVQRALDYPFILRFFFYVFLATLFFRLVVPERGPVTRFCRTWYAYFLVPVCLYSVGWLNQVHFAELPYDGALAELDRVFGFDPAIDFRAAMPYYWLEEFLNLAYLNFYYMGLLIGIPIYYKCNRKEFDLFMTVLILGFLINFVLAIIFPAAGPIFYYVDGIRFPYFVQGQILETDIGPMTTLMRSLIYGGEIPAGAIPSAHCAIAFIAVIFGFKHFGKWGFIYLFWSASLWVSTVYLQQHYAIDVFAGLLIVYPFIYYGGGFLHRNFNDYLDKLRDDLAVEQPAHRGGKLPKDLAAVRKNR